MKKNILIQKHRHKHRHRHKCTVRDLQFNKLK